MCAYKNKQRFSINDNNLVYGTVVTCDINTAISIIFTNETVVIQKRMMLVFLENLNSGHYFLLDSFWQSYKRFLKFFVEMNNDHRLFR